MAEQQQTCLCKREKELDRLFTEFDTVRTILDNKINAADHKLLSDKVDTKLPASVFWTVVIISIGIMTTVLNLHIGQDDKEFKDVDAKMASMSSEISVLSMQNTTIAEWRKSVDSKLDDIIKLLRK